MQGRNRLLVGLARERIVGSNVLENPAYHLHGTGCTVVVPWSQTRHTMLSFTAMLPQATLTRPEVGWSTQETWKRGPPGSPCGHNMAPSP